MGARPRSAGSGDPASAGTGVSVYRDDADSYAQLRRYEVYIDGKRVGRLRRGELVNIPVTVGSHAVQVWISWCSSGEVPVEVGAGERVSLICRAKPGASTDLGGVTRQRDDFLLLREVRTRAGRYGAPRARRERAWPCRGLARPVSASPLTMRPGGPSSPGSKTVGQQRVGVQHRQQHRPRHHHREQRRTLARHHDPGNRSIRRRQGPSLGLACDTPPVEPREVVLLPDGSGLSTGRRRPHPDDQYARRSAGPHHDLSLGEQMWISERRSRSRPIRSPAVRSPRMCRR